jgi:hypothetical protein
MATKYKLYAIEGVAQPAVQRTTDDGIISVIPFNIDNIDYAEYKLWLDAGNTPEAAD